MGRHIFPAKLLRALTVVLGVLLPLSAARAAPPPVVPRAVCIRLTTVSIDPFALLKSPDGFDCERGQVGAAGPFSWELVRDLNLVTDPSDPWELRHEYSQSDGETVFVRYADGHMIQAPSDRASARRIFSPGMVSFKLPAARGTITAVLIRVENLRNQRGIASALEISTGQAALRRDLPVLFLYGILAGIVGTLLIYNFALFVSLRYTFILCYCLSAVAMLGVGFSWSGGIFLLFPHLDTTEQISLTMLATISVLAVSVLFLRAFIETEFLPRRLWGWTMAVAVVGLGSCIARLINSRFAWQAMDQVSYWSIIVILIGLVATAAVATRRGSASARIYLLAWTVPIVAGIVRSFWAMGFIGGTSVLVAMSPLILMAIEALMSALAVSWRVGKLRNERDEARALQAQLRDIADTDVLTGLFNRRAFIDRALSEALPELRQRLIIVDIDRFKTINDTHGHQAGDHVLAGVARTIAETSPGHALVGRIGGEEFAVLLPATPVDALPERLCRAVADLVCANDSHVTISVGVAEGIITGKTDFHELYNAADQALYRAKNGGRNHVSHAPTTIAA